MNLFCTPEELINSAKLRFEDERSKTRLDGWFLCKEIAQQGEKDFAHLPEPIKTAELLRRTLEQLPLYIDKNAVFAGTQRDAFARSYALINPTFTVESFSGYCDPLAVYGDIEPNGEFPKARIDAVKNSLKDTPFVTALAKTYEEAEPYTKEVAFFIEQVTGHLIPDFQKALKVGLCALISELEGKLQAPGLTEKVKNQYTAMKITLESAILLANRYKALAAEAEAVAEGTEKARLSLMKTSLERVPEQGALNLHEAMQSYLLLWQVMCIEQAPNPFAFSVGNVDRIFEPYRSNLSRAEVTALFTHFLVFFNVGDRSWAISQNVIVGGKSSSGTDLTNETTFAVLDAYFTMNLPQPILSVKLHKNTPETLYEALGKFLFTPGVLTPSFFNDDSVFPVLEKNGIEKADLEAYSIAGCQEPLIMGKDSGNTTNSWLNLAKILELTLTGGQSLVTGKQLLPLKKATLSTLRETFYENTALCVQEMAKSANGATEALSHLPVPFLSAFMGGLDSGIDARDVTAQGTKYNGSGCLIHGLSVVADSFVAIDTLLRERLQDADKLIPALQANFEGFEELRTFLQSCEKFGNNKDVADSEAAEVAEKIAALVNGAKNNWNNPFRPDFSTPSTHLLYGYWVGATPDGRKSREMLGYGIDPLYGDANTGLGFRMLSHFKLPFEVMSGGYASHFGIDPRYFKGQTLEEKGVEFKQKVLSPLFFNEQNPLHPPFYLYVNVTTRETLEKVLENPKKYAPSGVYIMRIHGTFVNFLALSPAIQKDIMRRLDPASTKME